MSRPGLALAIDPQPGQPVRFKYRGQWIPGIVVGEGTELRLPIRREFAPSPTYWRNRTQVYERSTDAGL